MIIRESGLLLSNMRWVWRYSFLTLQIMRHLSCVILKVSTRMQHRLHGHNFIMCFCRQLRAWLRNHYATLTPNTPKWTFIVLTLRQRYTQSVTTTLQLNIESVTTHLQTVHSLCQVTCLFQTENSEQKYMITFTSLAISTDQFST